MTQGSTQLPTSGTLDGMTAVADINTATKIIITDCSGPTAPTAAGLGLATLAGIKWHDTGTNKLWERDQADTAWILLGTYNEVAKTFAPAGLPALATVATSGAYADLSGTPTLGTASALDAGTAAGQVVKLDASAKLPAVDGSRLTNLPVPSTAGLVAKAGDTMTGPLVGPQYKTSGSTAAATGFKIADGTDLSAVFKAASYTAVTAVSTGGGGAGSYLTTLSLAGSISNGMLYLTVNCNSPYCGNCGCGG